MDMNGIVLRNRHSPAVNDGIWRITPTFLIPTLELCDSIELHLSGKHRALQSCSPALLGIPSLPKCASAMGRSVNSG